jgi:hypothetical protein
VERNDFCGANDDGVKIDGEKRPPRKKRGLKSTRDDNEPFLLVGFDTEFKTPPRPLSFTEVAAGEAKYEVLSYQFCCRMQDGRVWSEICCPDKDARMSLGEFIIFALGSGAREAGITNIPTNIFLVGHFTRADVPAFADFHDLTDVLSNVRNTFISVDSYVPLDIKFPDGEAPVELKVRLRDTMLLSPGTSKSLAAIGELIGKPKIILDPDPERELWMKQNMDVVRRDHWPLFREYALNDAIICTEYIDRIQKQYKEITGVQKIPTTLTSIGVDLLLKSWDETLGVDELEILGKEVVINKVWDKRKGYYVKVKKKVDLAEIHWNMNFVTECYHGGRNEQFWFGPGFEDVWTDYDLSSAYPTAMSLIGVPQWCDFYHSTDLDDFTPTTLGFALVDFAFPEGTRFPTLPVRTAHGLVFPMSGSSYCAAPEIALAKSLGAGLIIRYSTIIPTDDSCKIFGEFIKECLDKRSQYPKRSFDALFWKEISNSTYGKTAQGLMAKRVYDMRSRDTVQLPPSKITNPFFAAFITSFVRAILGEVINKLPDDVAVFSCTTDGFLTNAAAHQIKKAQSGELSAIFRGMREELTGKPGVLEVKHCIRQPLGWRTRGQATLIPGVLNPDDDGFHIVLAKSGIFTPAELKTDEEENTAIVKLFLERTPEHKITVAIKTGIRDMVERDADLVEKLLVKRLNMEFDWKRRPYAVGTSATHHHLAFSTIPWQTIEDFNIARELWEKFQERKAYCLKSVNDFHRFADFVEASMLTPSRAKGYLRSAGSVSPDISRLRLLLCSAWRQSQAGLSYDPKAFSAKQFAQILSDAGVPCNRYHVENGKRRPFDPMSCPPTLACHEALERLSETFPGLDSSVIFGTAQLDSLMRTVPVSNCIFVTQCETRPATGDNAITPFQQAA